MCPEPKNEYRLHINYQWGYFNSKSYPKDKDKLQRRYAMEQKIQCYHPKDLKVKVRKESNRTALVIPSPSLNYNPKQLCFTVKTDI
jgi:hypothetical protein